MVVNIVTYKFLKSWKLNVNPVITQDNKGWIYKKWSMKGLSKVGSINVLGISPVYISL